MDSDAEASGPVGDPPLAVAVSASPPDGDRSAPIQTLRWALTLVVAAQFVLQLDFSIVNVALPTIQRQLHFSPADLQWIVTGYALTFGSLLLIGGRLGDVVGRRRLLMTGLVLFALTSLSAGLAQDPLMLVVSRFAQGASAAMVAPMALAQVTDLYAEGPGRVRALGIFQGATAAGASTGIVLGGILTQYVGWRAIFLVNPPIIAILVVAMVRLLPAQARTGTAARLDIPGAVLATVSIASLIFGLSEGQQHGFAAPLTVAALVVAVVLGTAFVVVQRRSRSPMVPLNVLAEPTRRIALIVMVLMGAVVAGYVYFTSLYLQKVLHFSALLTGLALIPATATVMLVSVLLTRRLLARFGTRPLLLAGLFAVGVGQLWLSRIDAGGSYTVNVLGGLVFTAFGMGLVFPTASVAVTAGMGPSERGLAGGLFATALQVGQAVGLAILATIAAARTASAHDSLARGYQLSFLIAVGIVAVAFATVLLHRHSRDNAETSA
jgi:EmrB/QacA subfamily drug resistance transporter